MTTPWPLQRWNAARCKRNRLQPLAAGRPPSASQSSPPHVPLSSFPTCVPRPVPPRSSAPRPAPLAASPGRSLCPYVHAKPRRRRRTRSGRRSSWWQRRSRTRSWWCQGGLGFGAGGGAGGSGGLGVGGVRGARIQDSERAVEPLATMAPEPEAASDWELVVTLAACWRWSWSWQRQWTRICRARVGFGGIGAGGACVDGAGSRCVAIRGSGSGGSEGGGEDSASLRLLWRW